jgi:hypothetical protein
MTPLGISARDPNFERERMRAPLLLDASRLHPPPVWFQIVLEPASLRCQPETSRMTTPG